MNGPEVDNRPTLTTKNQEQQLLQRLVQLPLFVRLAGRQLQVLLKASRSLVLQPDEALWLAGDAPRSFFVLLKGRLAVIERGREIAQVHPLVAMGEIPLLAGLPHDDEVVAGEECLLLEFPGEAVDAVFRSSSDICQRLCRNVVNLLSLRLQKANERMSEIARQRTELEEQIREAEIHFNDLNLIKRLRS